MGLLNKAKQEAAETPEEEAAESPQEEQQEQDEGTEADTPETDSAEESAPDDESAENDETGGLSPEQLDEYRKASLMLHTVLYRNENTGKAVLAQISDHPEDKVASIARATVLVIQQLDKRLNFDNGIIPLMIITVVDRLLEMADKVKHITFSEQESAAVVKAATQGLKALFSAQPPQETPQPGAQPGAEATEAAAPNAEGTPAPAGPGLPAQPAPGPAPQPGVQ